MSDKSNNLLAPVSPTFVVPKAIQELKNSSSGGSATGNPRNKCALKPGHSLMDWIRLGNSGVDLSGTRGCIVPVTSEELAKHNTREDAWMAIRGFVYNVTRYMDFHPGGAEELMRGVGKDATKLFNEVHAWVNYQQLLNKCRIGPLKNSAKLNSVLEDSLSKKFAQDTFALNRPPLPPQDVTPRLDWIQNRNTITLYFYTKQFCNPGAIIQRQQTQKADKSLIEIWVLIDLHMHKYEFEFSNTLKWPPKEIKIATESGKIEIVFDKSDDSQDIWKELGKHQVKKLLRNTVEDAVLFEFQMLHRENYNHDSFQMLLKNDSLIYRLPLGFHVSLETTVNSKVLSKPYTPIPENYLSNGSKSDLNTLVFLIKKYKHVNSFSLNLSAIPADTLLKVSIPKGNFKLSTLSGHRCLCFLAAGSGLTPFLSLIDHLLKRKTNRIELLKLFYFNKTSEDIWCQDVLSQIADQDERFEFINVLSKPDDSWSGISGHISVDTLKPILDKSSLTKITYIGACGPSGFNQKMEDILKELEFPKENLFIF